MSFSSRISKIWTFVELGHYTMFAATEGIFDNAIEQWDALWRFSFTGASV